MVLISNPIVKIDFKNSPSEKLPLEEFKLPALFTKKFSYTFDNNTG